MSDCKTYCAREQHLTLVDVLNPFFIVTKADEYRRYRKCLKNCETMQSLNPPAPEAEPQTESKDYTWIIVLGIVLLLVTVIGIFLFKTKKK